MNRKNLASILGVLIVFIPVLGISPSFERGLTVLFGLSIPFVLLLPSAQIKQTISNDTLSSNGETISK